MPTTEEIKSMAREYARCTCIGTFDAERRAEEEKVEYDFALPVIEWLAEHYCLVEKSKVKEVAKYPQRHTAQIQGTMVYQVQGIRKALVDLFGKEMFEE